MKLWSSTTNQCLFNIPVSTHVSFHQTFNVDTLNIEMSTSTKVMAWMKTQHCINVTLLSGIFGV